MSINKISPPLLGKVLLRGRLFDILNLSSPTSAVWLSGPGGSGKSTLIASFLTAQRIPCLWYQFDQSDEDLATFFSCLGQAATQLLDANEPHLPLLTPEYLLGVETFAQRYFENFFQRLKTPCWIVFDNHQEVPVGSGIEQILMRAIEQLPRGITITVVSRRNPPAAMARLQANRLMKCVGWKELAFTFEEIRDVLKILSGYQVQRFIARHQLMPDAPRLAGPYWPWPVKIYTLGRFEILCLNRPLKLSAKTPKKPLELLKMLVCRRPLGVTRETAIDYLWPDTDGDRAIQNLNTTLHRLRKMLGQDKTVVLESGRLSLNPALCWVDAWYFEGLVKHAKSASNSENVIDLLAKSLSIYAGYFDNHQEGNAAIIGYAEKLKSMWIDAVTDLGTALSQSGKHQPAVDMLQEALTLDDTAEPIYQSLMAVLSTQGRVAEAMLTFNRCCSVLAKQGIDPAEDTKALYHDMQAVRSTSERHRG
jgi:DNA-binding SARP family transcriptional activator